MSKFPGDIFIPVTGIIHSNNLGLSLAVNLAKHLPSSFSTRKATLDDVAPPLLMHLKQKDNDVFLSSNVVVQFFQNNKLRCLYLNYHKSVSRI